MCSPYLELTLTEVKAKWKDTKKKCINNMTKSLNCQADLIKGKHLPNVFTVMASVYSGTTGSDKLRTPHLYRKACHTCSFVFSFTQVLPFCRPKSGTSFPLDRLQRNEAKSNSDVSTACVTGVSQLQTRGHLPSVNFPKANSVWSTCVVTIHHGRECIVHTIQPVLIRTVR